MKLPGRIKTTATIANTDLEACCYFDYDPGDERNPEELTVWSVMHADLGEVIRASWPDEREVLEENLLIELHAILADQRELAQEHRRFG